MPNKIAQIKKKGFRNLLTNELLFNFFKGTVTESYVQAAPDDKDKMRALLDKTFSALKRTRKNGNAFKAAVKTLFKHDFRKSDERHWFGRIYYKYKMDAKPARRFARLKGLLTGKKVLDVGCGDGRLSVILHRHGYTVSLADVLDFRDKSSYSLPFKKMNRASTLPFPDKSFDTAVVFDVLHHIYSKNLDKFLRELRRVSRRIIIEEDCYDIPANVKSFKNTIRNDKKLREYRQLSKENQFGFLMLTDYFGNALTAGVADMNMPFEFKTIGEWQTVFKKNGFRIRNTILLGFQKGFFNRVCHVWFILDAPNHNLR